MGHHRELLDSNGVSLLLLRVRSVLSSLRYSLMGQ